MNISGRFNFKWANTSNHMTGNVNAGMNHIVNGGMNKGVHMIKSVRLMKNVVIDNGIGSGDPEIRREIKSMLEKFSGTIYSGITHLGYVRV